MAPMAPMAPRPLRALLLSCCAFGVAAVAAADSASAWASSSASSGNAVLGALRPSEVPLSALSPPSASSGYSSGFSDGLGALGASGASTTAVGLDAATGLGGHLATGPGTLTPFSGLAGLAAGRAPTSRALSFARGLGGQAVSVGARTASLARSAASTINPSQVLALAEGAGKFFARTFRAFSASPAETVRFDLFTRRQQTTPTRIYARKKDSVEQSAFDPSKPTKVLIHGFLSHQGPGSGGDALKDAFLAVQDCNVVTVDWSGADPREYGSAVSLAVPRVAAEVAELLRLLHGLGASLDGVHVLGHSLGAQIAGVAAGQVLGAAGAGRVTGLDPAGPLFEGRDAALRLDASDAAFVDVVHTDGGQLGLRSAAGHADFFPDGGLHAQPGCGKDVTGICSHCLVYDLFIDALLRPGADVYRRCGSWRDYQDGACGAGGNAVMGLYTDPRSRGSFFLAGSRLVRKALQKGGEKDFIGLFSLRREAPGRDGVTFLQC